MTNGLTVRCSTAELIRIRSHIVRHVGFFVSKNFRKQSAQKRNEFVKPINQAAYDPSIAQINATFHE